MTNKKGREEAISKLKFIENRLRGACNATAPSRRSLEPKIRNLEEYIDIATDLHLKYFNDQKEDEVRRLFLESINKGVV